MLTVNYREGTVTAAVFAVVGLQSSRHVLIRSISSLKMTQICAKQTGLDAILIFTMGNSSRTLLDDETYWFTAK